MSWFKSILKSDDTQKVPSPPTNTPYSTNKLDLKTTVNIVPSCEAEIAQYREFAYTPLPQRIYSKGIANLANIGHLKRYYLNDGDTWLQCTYLDENATNPIATILFYWTASTSIKNLDEAKAPLYYQQWLYNDELFPRVWLAIGEGYQPQLFTEQIQNSHETYQVSYQAMLFGKLINKQTNRYEYWLYSLEQDQQGKWQQTIAQGFSISPTEFIN